MKTCRECDVEFDPRAKRNGGLSVHCDDCSSETVSRANDQTHRHAIAVHSTNPGKWGAGAGEVRTRP